MLRLFHLLLIRFSMIPPLLQNYTTLFVNHKVPAIGKLILQLREGKYIRWMKGI